MTNHVHFLMTPHSERGISEVMQSLGRYYVQYFNYQYRRTGTLWEGRYKATVIDSAQYLLTCSRYIELNPVRAGMVLHPAEYPWSSYHCNALGKKNALITPHQIYQLLGNGDTECQLNYRALFDRHIPEAGLEEIRAATNNAWALGDDRFKAQVEKLSKRQATPKPRGGNRRIQALKEV